MELLIIWTVFAVAVGSVAPGRGRSFAAWTLLGLVISPLITLVLLVVLPNMKEQREREAAVLRELNLTRKATEAALAATQAPAQHVESLPSSDDIAAKIRTLADLRDRDILTDLEYQAKKAELLGRF